MHITTHTLRADLNREAAGEEILGIIDDLEKDAGCLACMTAVKELLRLLEPVSFSPPGARSLLRIQPTLDELVS
ncbi:MAG TPA: hypothetical protein VK386_06010 [Acidimicrobiales bacterium]|nr:hypothetical protein [Acidimicrobiales bacterium]